MASEKMKPFPKEDRKLALVIVDVQKKFILNARDTTLESVKDSTPLMLDVIRKFREAGRPVIWVFYAGKTCLKGITDETDILLDGFEIAEGDHVIRKYHMNSFYNTNLADIVHSYDCDGVLIMGMFAQYCAMATYWGAFDKELSPYMMEGGLISTDQKYCDLAVELCKSYSMAELDINLQKNRVLE